MLTRDHLVSNFSRVEELRGGVFKFQDVTPKSTYYYYLRVEQYAAPSCDLLLVSENRADDEFALLVLGHVSIEIACTGLQVQDLPTNRYGFSSLLRADSTYHSYFKGLLDEHRERLVLCLPAHRCEFSGEETREEFALLRREVVQSLNWEREPSPKIILRFDNPKTKGGTRSSGVFARYNTLLREIDNLIGVPQGFIEITNYQNRVAELSYAADDKFWLIRDRSDERKELLEKPNLHTRIRSFLVG
jgi:hypothetical protein